VRFCVLGPVEAYDGETCLSLGGVKPRLLLAALLSEPDRVLPAERLIDILWDDDPPKTARALIHTYVKTLRHALNRPGDEVIVTRPPGYLAKVKPDELDSVAFERLVTAAREAARNGDHEQAVRHFHAAEALWRGAAYGGIGESALATEAARLESLRLAAVEERITAEMALGRAEELVGELTALVGAHRTHERLRARLMVVLYRLGRQADALASYREGRAELVDQLGIDPGPELQRVHDAILRADPDLLGPTPPAPDRRADEQPEQPTPAPPAPAEPAASTVPAQRAGAPTEADVPAQLPAVPSDFTGRADQLATLKEHLTVDGPAAAASVVCVIAGKGGAGKSTLALRVGHDLADAFPDGQLYADLRGTTGHAAQPVEVLGRFLRALGVDAGTLPESVEERSERLRTVLAARRVLVVLDDALDERQVRPLLPGGAGNTVMVTSRRRLPGLAGVMHLDLDMLDEEEAVTLLGRIAGEARVVAQPQAAAELVRLCGRLPLAVRVVGARLAGRPHWTLASMATRLADERRRLDELAVADQQVRAGIAITYEGLDGPAREALKLLGTMGLPDFPGWVVAPLLDIPVPEAEEIIEGLVDAQVVDFARLDELGMARYRVHELIRVYAIERVAAESAPDEVASAVRRLLGTWLWLVGRITEMAPTGAIPFAPEQPRVHRPDPAVAEPILARPAAWLEVEQPALVVAVEAAAGLGLVEASVALASALCGSVFAFGNEFAAWRRTHTAALVAAREAADRTGEAVLIAQLGQLSYMQDDYAGAHGHLLDALTIFRELGDGRGEATVQASLGWICREQGRLREALHFLRQAYAYFTTTSLDSAIGYTGRLIGTTRLEQGDFAQSRADLTDAVEAYRRLGSRQGEALAVRSLGLVHRAMGELDEALAASLEALAIFRSLHDEKHEAYGLQSVAKTLIRLGRVAEARPMLDQALSTCERLGDIWGLAFMLRTRGELHLAAGRLDEAEADLRGAIRQWQQLDVTLMPARAERDLAALLDARGDHPSAGEVRQRAMQTFKSCGAREYSELALAGDL
jgi:DNA-binding SARP family transcriptional activator/tetratricopeptide (TPR) repeat protein